MNILNQQKINKQKKCCQLTKNQYTLIIIVNKFLKTT